MKLLIDEMFPPRIAVSLREAHGHDVVSVLELPDLRGSSDNDMFEHAQVEGRAVVTENVRDYVPLARGFARIARVHHGVVLTTDRRFPRARRTTATRLIAALDTLLSDEGEDEEPSSREIWL